MLQLRWFLVGQLLINMGNVHSLVLLEQWQCGIDNETREMAYIAAKEECPDVMDMFNECCIIHDTCYTDQLGKGSCDEQFCDCMNNAAFKAKELADCQLKAFVACVAVQTFGDGNYEEAAQKPHIIQHNSNNSTKHLSTKLADPSLKSTNSKEKLKGGKMKAIVNDGFTISTTNILADSTKSSKLACVFEDFILKHWYTKIFEDCRTYREEFSECCSNDAICHQNISNSQMLCPLRFAECLLQKLKVDKNDWKCYESIHVMHTELSYNEERKKRKDLLETIEDWINGISRNTISSSTKTINNLENIRWINILFIGMMIVIFLLFLYILFFSDIVSWLRWEASIKFIPEKVRLIQIV